MGEAKRAREVGSASRRERLGERSAPRTAASALAVLMVNSLTPFIFKAEGGPAVPRAAVWARSRTRATKPLFKLFLN
jgi:hypothetical protein